MTARLRNAQDELNRFAPAAAHVKLGDLIEAVITQYNLLVNSVNTKVVTKAGLAIKTAGSAIVHAASPILAVVGGAAVRKAANTDMAALAGTLATAKSAAWAFYIDATGTLSTSAKTTDAATHDAAVALLPALPDGKAQIGVVVIDNATGSNFVGGTTALDTASLTVTYYDTTGPFLLATDPANTALADLSTHN